MNGIDPTVLIAMIKAHPYMTLAAALYWLFSNQVLKMNPVTPQSSKLYKTEFAVLHFIAGALPRIASNGLLPPWLAKFIAGGNGASTENPQGTPAKVDSAPPKG
jgi:hypothetical protein